MIEMFLPSCQAVHEFLENSQSDLFFNYNFHCEAFKYKVLHKTHLYKIIFVFSELNHHYVESIMKLPLHFQTHLFGIMSHGNFGKISEILDFGKIWTAKVLMENTSSIIL